MPHAADRTLRRILGRSLIVSGGIAAAIRRSVLRVILGVTNEAGTRAIQGAMWRPLVEQAIEPGLATLAKHHAYTDLSAWIVGNAWAFAQFPPTMRDQFQPGRVPPGFAAVDAVPPTDDLFGDFAGNAPENVRFPKLEFAAKRLIERNVITRPEFDAASEAAQKHAFTIAGGLETGTIETVRDVLAEDIDAGTSHAGFRRSVEKKLGKSPIGDAHLENVYRTNVQGAFRDGREKLTQNPVVAAMFPYQQYVPIGDDRTRDEHLACGALGLNGTGVYRRDDPFWDNFTPPWGYQCRCGVRLLTVAQAAAMGVAEAVQWRDSGEPPETPEWRMRYIPFDPQPGWGHRGG